MRQSIRTDAAFGLHRQRVSEQFTKDLFDLVLGLVAYYSWFRGLQFLWIALSL